MTFLSVGPSASCPLPPPTQVTVSFNYSPKTVFSESPIPSSGCNINITAYQNIALLTKTEDENHCHSSLLLLAWNTRNKASLWLEFGCLFFKARKAFQAKHSAWKETAHGCARSFEPHSSQWKCCGGTVLGQDEREGWKVSGHRNANNVIRRKAPTSILTTLLLKLLSWITGNYHFCSSETDEINDFMWFNPLLENSVEGSSSATFSCGINTYLVSCFLKNPRKNRLW